MLRPDARALPLRLGVPMAQQGGCQDVSEILVAVVALLVAVVLIGVVVDFDNFQWFRKSAGGHWERWEPGFLTSGWWIRSPDGRCSGMSVQGGRQRVRCEDWGGIRT